VEVVRGRPPLPIFLPPYAYQDLPSVVKRLLLEATGTCALFGFLRALLLFGVYLLGNC